jgi:flagellin
MSVINTNVKSLIAQNSLKLNERSLSASMQQLSTGSRINTAGDDAAGLAISAKMTSQIRGLDTAVRNGNDAISLLQTGEGAMVEMTNMLQRMRELSVQSANDTNTGTDKTALNDEFQQLKQEINRIAKNTQWNGVNILDGNDAFGTVSGALQTVNFQMGANANQNISIDFKDFSFTPGASSASKSTATIEFAAKTAGTDAARFKATFGTVNVNFAITALAANPTDANTAGNIGQLASELQAGLRAYAGLENATVTSLGETLTITDPSGKAISNIKFRNAADSADGATTLEQVTIANGSTAAGAGPVGSGTFTADLAGATITTAANSNSAIGFIDTALSSLNAERSKFGATINRLTYAIDNLTNVSQNTSASRSRILDTDYAKASTELARSQIIQQAATAMLAQANQSSQSVLALLK